jgi:hypothetical protein
MDALPLGREPSIPTGMVLATKKRLIVPGIELHSDGNNNNDEIGFFPSALNVVCSLRCAC